MALNQYFSASFILHQVDLTSKEDIFLKFAEKAYNTNLIADKEQFYRALLEQEHKLSSGMEYGVAISHIRTPLTRKSFMMLATLKRPLTFSTFDESLVRIVVLLCAPPDENHIYLQLLARISRILLNESNRKAILEAVGPNALFQLIESYTNWDIVTDKSEHFLMNLILYRDDIFDDVVECLLEVGLIRAQITRAIPIRKYISQKFSVFSNSNVTGEENTSNSIIITGIVSDKEIARHLQQLLTLRNIDLTSPGYGILTLTKIDNLIGEEGA